jgi:hypothetical protein
MKNRLQVGTRFAARLFLLIGLLAGFLVVLLVPPAWARSHSHSVEPSITSDPGYGFALAAADRFLQAWQTGDVESGMVLVGDSVRHSQSADKLEQFFSNAHANDRAFEITRGHGRAGRYSFPVVLVTPLVTPRGTHVTRRFSEITVVDAGKNDWVVDKLP